MRLRKRVKRRDGGKFDRSSKTQMAGTYMETRNRKEDQGNNRLTTGRREKERKA